MDLLETEYRQITYDYELIERCIYNIRQSLDNNITALPQEYAHFSIPSQALADRLLSVEDIEWLTGISSDQQARQANWLRRNGVRCLVNSKKQLIVAWTWFDYPDSITSTKKTGEVDSAVQDARTTRPRYSAVRGYASR